MVLYSIRCASQAVLSLSKTNAYTMRVCMYRKSLYIQCVLTPQGIWISTIIFFILTYSFLLLLLSLFYCIFYFHNEIMILMLLCQKCICFFWHPKWWNGIECILWWRSNSNKKIVRWRWKFGKCTLMHIESTDKATTPV